MIIRIPSLNNQDSTDSKMFLSQFWGCWGWLGFHHFDLQDQLRGWQASWKNILYITFDKRYILILIDGCFFSTFMVVFWGCSWKKVRDFLKEKFRWLLRMGKVKFTKKTQTKCWFKRYTLQIGGTMIHLDSMNKIITISVDTFQKREQSTCIHLSPLVFCEQEAAFAWALTSIYLISIQLISLAVF